MRNKTHLTSHQHPELKGIPTFLVVEVEAGAVQGGTVGVAVGKGHELRVYHLCVRHGNQPTGRGRARALVEALHAHDEHSMRK